MKTEATGHAHPWYKNHLFWSTVGSGILTVVDKQTHAGFPVTGAAAVTVGLGIAFGIHTIIVDAKNNSKHDPILEQIATIIPKGIEFLISSEDKMRTPSNAAVGGVTNTDVQPASTDTAKG